MPVRANQLIQTPYMKEGSTKVLDNQTGMFLYNPPNEEAFKPTFNKPAAPFSVQKTLQKSAAQPSSNIKMVELEPKTKLKRTFSSPNIAKLDDDQIILNPEIDKKAIINNLNPPDLANIDESKQPAVKSLKETFKPVVNRNKKPMPDHIMRTRIEDLQPVFGINNILMKNKNILNLF